MWRFRKGTDEWAGERARLAQDMIDDLEVTVALFRTIVHDSRDLDEYESMLQQPGREDVAGRANDYRGKAAYLAEWLRRWLAGTGPSTFAIREVAARAVEDARAAELGQRLDAMAGGPLQRLKALGGDRELLDGIAERLTPYRESLPGAVAAAGRLAGGGEMAVDGPVVVEWLSGWQAPLSAVTDLLDELETNLPSSGQ